MNINLRNNFVHAITLASALLMSLPTQAMLLKTYRQYSHINTQLPIQKKQIPKISASINPILVRKLYISVPDPRKNHKKNASKKLVHLSNSYFNGKN